MIHVIRNVSGETIMIPAPHIEGDATLQLDPGEDVGYGDWWRIDQHPQVRLLKATGRITLEEVKWTTMDKDTVGVAVTCTVCRLRKKPRGRDAALAMANSLCDFECPGYSEPPEPGHLWPGESQKDFGY